MHAHQDWVRTASYRTRAGRRPPGHRGPGHVLRLRRRRPRLGAVGRRCSPGRAASTYTRAEASLGTPAEVAPDARGDVRVHLLPPHHSTHQVRFTGPDAAVGRVHVFNRNGVEWEGRPELFDVGAVYDDAYVRSGDGCGSPAGSSTPSTWPGAGFADMIRSMINAPDRGVPPVFG